MAARLSSSGWARLFAHASSKFSDHERRLLRSIGMVLSARYQMLTNQALAAQSFQIFRGLPEDRFVSAFLDPAPHASAEAIASLPDRVADAIEVSAHQQHEHLREPPHRDRRAAVRLHARALPRSAADAQARAALFALC